MKYYKGTKKRKRSPKSKISSPGSQNTSNTERSYEESVTTTSQSSAKGRKRPSSASPTAKQSTGRTKRTKPNHTTPKEKYSKNRKASSENLHDSSDENEPMKMPKKRSQSSSARDSRSDKSSRKKTKSSSAIESISASSIEDKRIETLRHPHGTVQKNSVNTSSSAGGSRSDGSSRKRTKSSEAAKLSSVASIVYKIDKTPRSVQKNSRSTKKTKPKPKEPNSPVSSELEESVLEDIDSEEETQETTQQEEWESNSEISSGDGGVSCSEFLQQQVRILRSEFEIEDCPELASHLQGTKRQQKNHIPKEIVHKVLRKLNVKVEDELLRSLNRQTQRKILKQVDEIRSNYSTLEKKRTNEENTGQQPEVEELRKNVEMSMSELSGLKRLTDMASQIESLAEGFSTNTFADEVKHTNKLIKKISHKAKKEGFTNAFQEKMTTKDPLSHQEIVNKLFS